MARASAQEIDERAAAWAAKMDRGLTAAERRDLEAWLAADDRHLGAFGRMQALLLRTERAAGLGAHFRPEQFRSARSGWQTRRGLIGGGLVGSAAAAAAGVWIFAGATQYVTKRGEIRVIPLSDGSVVTLNTASRITVRYSSGTRRISLQEGEALFDVAKDAARPFLVAAGDLTVRAVGTSFAVRRIGGAPMQVLVREGIVDVSADGSPGAPAVRLTANMRASGPRAENVTTADLGRELLWREGRIAFEGETLAVAAAAFARYSDVRIVIADPVLANEAISGMYASSDPVGFVRAVAKAFGARVEVLEREVRLYR